MSFYQIPKDIAARKDVSLAGKLLYGVLYDYQRYTKRKGYNIINPGVDRLAKEIGVTKPVIFRAIKSLNKAGLLTVKKGSGRYTNTYEITSASSNETSPQREDNSSNKMLPQKKSVVMERYHRNNETSPQDAVCGNDTLHNQDHITRSYTNNLPAAQVRNEIWNTLENLFDFHPITKAERSRLGRAVSDLSKHGATENEIRKRYERHQTAWPDCSITIESLVKHWQRFAIENRRKPAGSCLEAKPGKYDRFRFVG